MFLNPKSPPTQFVEEFQIAPKNLYKAMMGKHYESRMKLLKAEKAQKESEAKLKKLKAMGTKEAPSEEKAEATYMSEAMDTNDMPQLISDDKETDDQPTGKKFTFKHLPPMKAPWQITFIFIYFSSKPSKFKNVLAANDIL